jgi:hypothetical protein
MDTLRHDEVSAMAATNANPPAIRRRQIGPVGTTARIIVGTLLVGSVAQGHLARGFHPSAWALGPVGHALNLAVFLVLYLRSRPATPPCSSTAPQCG